MRYHWEDEKQQRAREKREGALAIVYIALVVAVLFVLGCRDNYQWVCW
jgi:hypothetical protein